ncbi:MAG: hypothetical protein IJ514_02455 [Clostridia bacterium]|nr:hypothetical protein [Clostridia bacterium]
MTNEAYNYSCILIAEREKHSATLKCVAVSSFYTEPSDKNAARSKQDEANADFSKGVYFA